MKDIRFKLLTEKTDSEGKAPVFLFFNYNSRQFRYFTKEKCEPKHWDSDKMRFRKSMAGYQEANEFLQILEERLRKAYRDYMNKGLIPSPIMLRDELTPESVVSIKEEKQEYGLIEFFEKFIGDQKRRGIKDSTVVSYRTTVARFKRYEAKYGKLFVNKYTIRVHQQLLTMLSEDYNLHPNSIAQTNKHLKTFFKYCKDELSIPLASNHAKIKKSFITPERIFLSEGDLIKLKEVKVDEKLSRIRDAFLFACYTGLRYSDLSRIQSGHIIDKGAYRVVSFIPEKTNSVHSALVKRVQIPLLPDALEIIERYDGRQAKLLPILTNQKMNEYLKLLGMWAGLTELVEAVEYEKGEAKLKMVPKYQCLSMHIARHTYGTLSLQKGVPLDVLQKAMGHSDLKTTRIYAKTVDDFKDRLILEAWNR